MKKLKAKLKSLSGESIAEVMITLLIAALALTMLASVIFTSSKVITRSKANLAAYYDANNVLESQSGTARNVSASVQVQTGGSGDTATWGPVNLVTGGSMAVQCYVNDTLSAKPVVAYHASVTPSAS